ncbi:tetratricopeptide repeat protein [Malaciobacter molluscorum LMG 25693]|uniref:beta-lactamase n=3 Tax=Malaciobacter molluscorum TaxID=1032072 RepID=A0AB33GVA7_9BACT|nr:tetratricopeptide repeat protein [Malaciobacter molluscorum]AXX93448.1 tetratricopeptide repeat protein [Malaciobacter molluscorum LMG 25693]
MQSIKKLIILITLSIIILNAQELKKSKYDINKCIKITYTKEDIKKYKKLIEEGEIQGYSCAGIYYARQGNFDEAINYFNKGKEKGSIESYAQLGSLYSSFLHDYKKAVKNYKVAANAGHGKAAHNLGVYYYKNFKYDEAYKWFMKSYETGDLNSLLSIGLMYIDQKKYNEAIETFKKVGELGEPRGYYELGTFYQLNKDMQDKEKGIKYYKKCYEMEYGLCAAAIGEYYEEDKKDYKKAKEWYLRGSNLNYSGSMQKLGLLYSDILKDYDKAIYWYKRGFNELSCIDCALSLGIIYKNNIKDYDKAIYWYKKGIKLGDARAIQNLGFLYETKLNNKEKAIYWYKKALNTEVKTMAKRRLKELGVSYE